MEYLTAQQIKKSFLIFVILLPEISLSAYLVSPNADSTSYWWHLNITLKSRPGFLLHTAQFTMSFGSLMNLKASYHQTIILLNMEVVMIPPHFFCNSVPPDIWFITTRSYWFWRREDCLMRQKRNSLTLMSGMKNMKFNKCVIQRSQFHLNFMHLYKWLNDLNFFQTLLLNIENHRYKYNTTGYMCSKDNVQTY